MQHTTDSVMTRYWLWFTWEHIFRMSYMSLYTAFKNMAVEKSYIVQVSDIPKRFAQQGNNSTGE